MRRQFKGYLKFIHVNFEIYQHHTIGHSSSLYYGPSHNIPRHGQERLIHTGLTNIDLSTLIPIIVPSILTFHTLKASYICHVYMTLSHLASVLIVPLPPPPDDCLRTHGDGM